MDPARKRPRLFREISDLYLQLAVGGIFHSALRALLDAALIWAALAALTLLGLALGGGSSCLSGCVVTPSDGCCFDGAMLLFLAVAAAILLTGGMFGTYLIARRKLQHSVMATVFAILPLAIFPVGRFDLPFGKGWCAFFIFLLMYVGYRLSFPLRARLRASR